MNFSTPDKVSTIIDDLKSADRLRAPVRALIEGLFNGDPPYTPEEEKENKIQININWREGVMLLLQARQQYENAFLSPSNYFTIRVPDAPPSKAAKISGILTNNVNRLLKNSRPYLHTMREKFGSICLHGIGAQMWPDQYAPIPFMVPVEDMLVPTDTLITLENLCHLPIRRKMTPGQLFRKTLGLGDKIDPGWNVKMVRKILDSFKDLNQNQNNWNWYENPEQMAELWKQNQSYYDSDAVPVVKLWDFYYQSEKEKSCWYRCIVPDKECSPGIVWDDESPMEFVYQKDEPYADSLDQFIHVQFGDGNNKPPFMWHSVRGLGYLLFDVVNMMNRLRCQFTQKVHEDLMLMIRLQDPVDRSRLDKIYIGLNYAIIPDGLTFVKRDERYEPSKDMVEMLMANYKQLMGESSSAYTQDIDQGTPKERTATEVQALVTQTAMLTGSMLNLAYVQEKFAYQEICRRLTLPNTPDFTAKEFRSKCVSQGVPEKWINSERWEIEPERVLGQGNMQLEQAQAQALLNIRPMLNPEAQAKVLHEYVFAVTHDPKRTDALAPIDGKMHVSDWVHDTELVFGALMNGTLVQPRPGANAIEVVETMLGQMQQAIQRIMQSDGMGTPEKVMGLQLAAKYASYYIQTLSEDTTQKERATSYMKALTSLMNEVKGMAQRLQQAAEAQQQQNSLSPEAMANLQAKMAESQVKIEGKQQMDEVRRMSKQMDSIQKQQQRQQEFIAEQQRKNMEALSQVQRDTMLTTVEASAKAAEAEKAAAAPEATD